MVAADMAAVISSRRRLTMCTSWFPNWLSQVVMESGSIATVEFEWSQAAIRLSALLAASWVACAKLALSWPDLLSSVYTVWGVGPLVFLVSVIVVLAPL